METAAGISVMTVLLPHSRDLSSWQVCNDSSVKCTDQNNMSLQREVEFLRREILEREIHIMQVESGMITHKRQIHGGEWEQLREKLSIWQEKYERLSESHKKLQKLNQGLEEKMLKVVEKFETEKNALTRDIADLTSKLVDARLTIAELEEENEQYRNDCNVAVQLLQCKPSSFMAHKLNSLPHDLQEKVKKHLTPRTKRDMPSPQSTEIRTIRVPIPTLPSTAMVYSVSDVATTVNSQEDNINGSDSVTPDYVSAAIMAKVLEERAKERTSRRQYKCQLCQRCKYPSDLKDKSTQTKLLAKSFSLCKCVDGFYHSHGRSNCFSNWEIPSYQIRSVPSMSVETEI